jgi:hypothetical protein
MSFFSFSLPSFTSTDPVAAAQAKVEEAEKVLADAKAELEKAKSKPADTSDGVPATSAPKLGGRKRTYRNKEKRPAKRRRNGRRSIRS